MEKKSQTDKTSLLSQWKKSKKAQTGVKILKAPAGAQILLTHNQRRLWFLQQLYPNSTVYNYSEFYTFKGDLNRDNLVTSLNKVFQDHDILRSLYKNEDGKVSFDVSAKPEIEYSFYDFKGLSTLEAEAKLKEIKTSDANFVFDLAKHPIAIVSLIKFSEMEHRLMLTLHHISTDKWSMDILRKDWARYYKALCANINNLESQVEVQFSDFAYWQNDHTVSTEQLSYWKEKLSQEIPSINLPIDYPRPSQPSFKGDSTTPIFLSKELSEKVLQLAKSLETTPYVLFLSMYYVLLHRYSGQNDILIGSPIASRDQKALENTIGFFNDTIVLRTNLSSQLTFRSLVEKVKKTALEAFSNKDVPFDLLVKELGLERSLDINPFFQVMFLYHSMPQTPIFHEVIDVSYEFYNPGVSKFDLTLDVTEESGLVSYCFEYSTDLFSPATITRFETHFKLLIDGVVADPNLAIAKIPMFSDEDKAIFFSEIVPEKLAFDDFKGIHQIIEHICITTPEKTAVTYQDSSLTYGELKSKAEIVATSLLSKINTENEIVGLCLDRSLEMVIALVGILKAGCAYLPIDPNYPKQRIDFILHDAEINTIVTQPNLVHLFSGSEKDLTLIFCENEAKLDFKIEFPQVKESDLAYMIYTSGSTGKPKGVPITHRNIINSTGGRLRFYDNNPESFLLMSSISFDSSKAGIFWTLCTGGNLVITENRVEQDIAKIEDLIHKNKISHTLMLPSLYQLLLEYATPTKLKSLRTVMVAGEACPSALCDIHFNAFDNVDLYNEYGPTEATVWCIAHKVERKRVSGSVPLGKPVANAKIYLLDEFLNRVPIGSTGEIYVGGKGLSGRYYNRLDLTSQAYITNPFGSSTEDKLYKTGDLGRYNGEGNIEFLGRIDNQVKIRGYRIEVSEIEKVINEHNAVNQVVVLAEKFGKNDSKRLVAYINSSEQKFNSEPLKAYLNERLPSYMAPSLWVDAKEIPRLPNGKIDKVSLRALRVEETSIESEETIAPTTETEAILLDLWKEVLQIEVIGIHDNFFDLGGDSLLSIQFIAKAKKAGMALSPNQIFDYQTISKLAAFLDSKETQDEEWDYLVVLRKEGTKKPLFCVHAGGGHIFFYNVLTKHIDADRPIYALQASGVYAEKGIHESIEVMATDYLKAIQKVQPKGPYNIMVYCFSVAVGHQMAKQLSEQGKVANLIVMDTMADPWNLNTPKRLKMRLKSFLKRSLKNPFRTIYTMVAVRWVYYSRKFSKETTTVEEKALIEMNANLGKICKAYDWNPVDGQVSIILTEKEEESINTEIIESWSDLVSGDIRVARTKGVHLNLFEEPDVVDVSAKIDNFVL